MNRRDLLKKLFNTGATVVALDQGVPLLAQPARLIEPAKFEMPTPEKALQIGRDGVYKIHVEGMPIPMIFNASTFQFHIEPVYQKLRGLDQRYPRHATHRWQASGELFCDAQGKLLTQIFPGDWEPRAWVEMAR